MGEISKRISTGRYDPSRRKFIRDCAIGTAAFAYGPLLGRFATSAGLLRASGPSSFRFNMDQNWLFGGKFSEDTLNPGYDDGTFSKIDLPHCVKKLSWQNWDPDSWEDIWIYRRHFDLPEEASGRRAFLVFDGVMVGRTPVINGHELPEYLGGYLPSRYEVTNHVKDRDNVLAVKVDSRWSDVPPEGAPIGPKRIDYLEPGGIFRSVHLEVVPQAFISDVFAKPVNVLDASRRVEVTCTIDAAAEISKRVEVEVELRDGSRVISTAKNVTTVSGPGQSTVSLVLSDLGNVQLWSPDRPRMYDVITTLNIDGIPIHDYRRRIGFRDARFELEGFFLNGKRYQLFGLDRHELFPYVGFAMPERVMRRDAEILREKFNCNVVRCSHYPQSEAFLDACDELGLMVWEEVPGWGYVGDKKWQDFLLRDVREMIIRDRNHPAIIIWGTRVNESESDVELYKKTRAIARELDDSRPSSGTMTGGTRKSWEKNWAEDVFAFDDYHADPKGGVGIEEPVPGVPYLITEAVGQFNYRHPKEGFNAKYRRAGDVSQQMDQAIWHAQAHSKAGANARISGVIAWCAFDYGSLINSYNVVKCPGVADVFRIPKLGASFYLAQVDPSIRPVIEPDFYWDFGARTPHGPGKSSAIFSNCDRLELFIGGKRHSTLHPDSKNYPNLKHPPFFADLYIEENERIDLRIDGYVGDKLVLSKSFSGDPVLDQLNLESDDGELIGNGSDATRVAFEVVDRFGNPRLLAGGEVKFEVSGPGILVGDNPFKLEDSGGVGAVWIKSQSGSQGKIVVTAEHSLLGSKSVEINTRRENPEVGRI